MTKVDEKAFVPKIDADARRRLSEALDKDGVVAAMLIGSQARGEAGPLSDLDIAVWHEPDLGTQGCTELQRELASDASSVLGAEEADIVLLNEESPLVRFRAIQGGVRLVERDFDQRVRFETRALLEFFDHRPLYERFGMLD